MFPLAHLVALAFAVCAHPVVTFHRAAHRAPSYVEISCRRSTVYVNLS